MTTSVVQAPLSDEISAFFAGEQRLMADPAPLYRRLHEEAPVLRHNNKVLISRYADIREISVGTLTVQPFGRGTRYRDAVRQLDDESAQLFEEMLDFYDKRLVGADGARHNLLRRWAQPAFAPQVIAGMEGSLDDLAESLLAPLGDEVELISAFAYHLPLIVMCQLLDLPVDERNQLRDWSMDIGKFFGAGDWTSPEQIRHASESMFAMKSYLSSVFATFREAPSADLLGTLLRAQAEGRPEFGEDDLTSVTSQFILAGHETTTNLIAACVRLLLGDHRDVWELLKADASIAPRIVEETLRFSPPARYSEKVAATDFEFRGVEVQKFDTIAMMWGAANRDPEFYAHPDVFDINRTETTHVAFGLGVHVCLGAGLARLETKIALCALARRFPDMRLATDELRWLPSHLFNQLEALPVVLK